MGTEHLDRRWKRHGPGPFVRRFGHGGTNAHLRCWDHLLRCSIDCNGDIGGQRNVHSDDHGLLG